MSDKPHDRLFRSVFGAPEHAVGILRAALPAEVWARADASSLKPLAENLVTPELRALGCDLVFELKLGGVETEVLVFLEHETVEHRHLPFWLLSYGVGLIQRWLRDHPQASRLPLPVAVVVHQGTAPWKGPIALSELYGLPQSLASVLGRHAPELVPLVDDLGAQSAEELTRREGSPLMRLALALLREAGEDSDLIGLLEHHRVLVEAVRSGPQGREAFRLLLAYILRVRDPDPKQMGDRLEQALGANTKEEVMTAAERLEAQGWAKGKAEGKAEGLAEGRVEALRAMVTRQLRQRFGALPPEVQDRLGAAAVADLERWGDQILVAKTLAEVFSPVQ
jgi:predicted transposase YdaD